MNAIDLTNITREEWLALRKLGSSDAAAVCGLHPWRSPFQVFAELKGMIPPPEENEAMEVGREIEPVIANLFARRTELHVEKCTEMFIHPEHDFLTATPDYWVFENNERGIVECKNTSSYAAGSWADDGCPDAAHIQLMHQLDVTGLRFGYVAALIGGNRLVYRRFERDDTVIARIQAIEVTFWDDVLRNVPPPMRSDDGEILADIYPESAPASWLPLPEHAIDLIERYRAAKKEIGIATAEADDASTGLKALLGAHESGKVGPYVVSWKTQQRKAYPVEAKSFRMFSIKEAKGEIDGN